jgi:polysaccharide export outer membrane protein
VNLIIDQLPVDGWPRFIADAVWQSTLVGLLGLVCIHLIARRPATRACVSVCAIVAAVALPFFSAGARLTGWGLLAAPTVVPPADAQVSRQGVIASNEESRIYEAVEIPVYVGVPTGRTVDAAAVLAPQKPIPAEPAAQAVESFTAPTALLAIWIVLSLVLFARLLASVWQTRRLLRQSVPIADVAVSAAIQAAADRLGIKSPRVFASSNVKLPTVFAFGRGVVLLPKNEPASPKNNAAVAGSEGQNTHDQWFAIFCHELGHIRRRDGRNRLLVEIALALMPWQPLVWLLRREYLRHAEEACDDWAVASGVDPLEYATVLSDFIPVVPRLSLGASIMTTDAKSRILRLLSLRETPRPRTTWPQLVAISTAACAIVATVALGQRPAADKVEPAESPQSGAAVETHNTSDRKPVEAAETIDYVLEPHDLVTIDVLRLVPKAPYRIRAVDVLRVDVEGELSEQEIDNMLFVVAPGGDLNLGAAYGKVKVAGLSLDEARDAVEAHLRRTLKRAQVSLYLHESSGQVAGQHTVGVDGYLNLGAFEQVKVSGMTIGEARQAIETKLSDHFEKPSIRLALQSRNQFQGIAPRDRAAAESKSVYVLEPPDIIAVEPIRLLPKGPQRVERLDQLEIAVSGTLEEAPIKGPYQVDADGEISLGPEYGRLNVAGLTVKETIQKIDEHLSKTLVQPEVAVRITDHPKNKQVGGTHLIGPDGHVNLGTFGQVYVAGMTVDEARKAIEKKLAEHFDKPSVAVDVTAYNSKVYYIIVEGVGQGDSIHRYPLTGNETVLDALAQVNVIRRDMNFWILRPNADGAFQLIAVDWTKLKSGEDSIRKYQLRPGDRVFLEDAVQKSAPADPTKSNSAFGPPRNSNRGLTGRIGRE